MLSIDQADLKKTGETPIHRTPIDARALARVRAVRLNVLLRQVSLLSPQNRPYTFQRSRLARFPCANASFPVTFPHVIHHGTARKAPLFCVGVASSDVPRPLSL